ncbi:sensor domain-containing diguanylate cyclase [Thiohalorhabdus sp.]|uniref:sensor domain-containing diguanylate cyclase n=1 Tax=Thiohalorhabdus sp. TaxID=3094134 RepID=UPI002FC296CE
MESPPLPPDEPQRQAAVTAMGPPDLTPKEHCDRITRLLAKAVDVPTIFFSVIDQDRQIFTSIQGLDICETRREDSFCGHTILQHDIMVVENAATSPLFHDNPLVVGEPYIGFYAGIPIRSPEGYKVGSLCATDNRPRQFTEAIAQSLHDGRGLLESELLLRFQSIRDPLTEAYNRRHFDDILAREWARNQRTGSPLGLIMADIDHFKAYNDEYGHLQGDVCLREIAATLQSEAKRSGDLVFRVGGEEFAILLPNTPENGTAELAERARKAVKALGVNNPEPRSQGIMTLSIGAAAARPAESRPPTPEAFFRSVDDLLYQAKSGGRDRLIMAEESP